jgi:hypothetical protein
MDNQISRYIPGVCNIGPAEIARRKRIGTFGMITTIIAWAVFIPLNLPAKWRLLLFFPAAMTAIGYLQAYLHFCVAFGLQGIFNLMQTGRHDSITDAEFRRQDRRKAATIIMYSLIIGAVVAVVAYFL